MPCVFSNTDTGLSIRLPSPDFQNVEKLQFDRINRKTRLGDLIVFRDNEWTHNYNLNMRFTYIDQGKANSLLAFLKATLGLLITFLDWEGRTWSGVITTPQGNVTQPYRDGLTAVLEFQGNLLDFIPFGTNGIVINGFNDDSDSQSYDSTLQTDNKIILGGQTGSSFNFALARYDVNGILDSTFGNNGLVITDLGSSDDLILSLKYNGKIIVGGATLVSGVLHFALAQYNLDGSLDSTFGTNGIVITNLGVGTDNFKALVLQPDGKIIAAGVTYATSPFQIGIVRYNANGTLDSSFGTGGIVVTSFSNLGVGENDVINAVTLQADGKIVLAGGAYVTNSEFIIVRYNTNGTLDSSFGTGGVVYTSFGGNFDVAQAIIIQSDGKIIAGGTTDSGAVDFAIARYNTNGTLDSSFGTGGKVITDLGTNDDEINSLALQSDGKIVAVGLTHTGDSQYDFALVRYNANGSVNGSVITDLGSSDDEAKKVIVQPDGKIIVSGFTFTNETQYNFAVVRYKSNLILDS